MRGLAIFLILLAGRPFGQVEDRTDTLKASRVSSAYGSLVVPQRISRSELGTASGVSEAVRRFAGVQIRDYGGVGGLKTVNVRSLGSEHTGVFIDGIQVDNAQNMQVDLGRFSLDDLGSVSLYSGQKTSVLQSAKEYSSASALYLESSEPVFLQGKPDNCRVGARGGSFATLSPSATWEHLFRNGTSMRLSGEAVHSDGRYRFRVSDYRSYPDGHLEGYDTTMTRQNCDLGSLRLEGRLFGSTEGTSSWNIHAYFYGSDRGLPGPVYKRAGEYPLSEDRQKDLDAFVQGRFTRSLGRVWSVAGRAKCSFGHLEYIDFPELRPELQAAHFNYRLHSAYVSGAAMARLARGIRINLAQDFQYDYLDADLAGFAYPGRLSSWTGMTGMYAAGPFEASATALCLHTHDSFLSAGRRKGADRTVFMPSLVVKWKIGKMASIDASAKRSYRMPTFNDLYYSTVSTKTLDPEYALQLNLGGEWTFGEYGASMMRLRADVYHNRLKNKIIAVPTSNQFRWSMYNLGKVNVLGADLVADCRKELRKGSLGATLRYTFQKSVDRSDPGALTWGGQIPYIPLHSGSVNLFGVLSLWRLDVTMFTTGERYTTSANLPAYRMDPWTTLDAALSRAFKLRSGELSLKLSVINLFGENYSIVDNYPMPGTNAMLKVGYSF